MLPLVRRLLAPAAAVFVVLGACSDPNELGDATIANVEDTLTLWSLSAAPLTQPTAYSLNARRAVRTWESGTNFEFVYEEDAAGRSLFLPLAVLDLTRPGIVRPGLKRSSAATFEDMDRAPLNGYVTEDTIPIAEGDRYFVRTTVSTCATLGVPLYGKVEVLDIDSTAHTVTIRSLANQNCGFRDLDLGVPKD